MGEVHDIETLRSRIRSTPKRPRGRTKVWVQPGVLDMAHGWVLSFDQTLTKTGWSVLEHCPDSGLRLHAGGVLVPEVSPDLKSFEQTFARALALDMSIEILVSTWCDRIDAIVHEMPAVMGYRIESSLMAAFCIRRAAVERSALDKVAMISKQHAKAVWLGPDKGYEKRHVTSLVNEMIPASHRTTQRWTQDVHDSVLLALQHLHDRRAAQR